MLASICLHILHLIFYLTSSLANLWRQLDRRKPCPLKAARAKTPSHLALLLVGGRNGTHDVPDAVIDENVAQTISWCQDIGIGKLTIYANKGTLPGSAQLIRTRFLHDSSDCEEDTDSELEYPLTPPPSDTSDSRPLSPDDHIDLGVTSIYTSGLTGSKPNKRRSVLTRRRKAKGAEPSKHALAIHLISRESSKPAVASVACHYTRIHLAAGRRSTREEFSMSIDELNGVLEGRHGLQAPDFMIVHHLSYHDACEPLELHGFPPWQLRLTEIYRRRPSILDWWRNLFSMSSSLITAEEFRDALDDFAGAQIRLGK